MRLWLLIGVIFIGLVLAWNTYPELRTFLPATFQYKTLEVRYSAENIMEKHKKELLKDHNHSFLDPDLKFVPYLLFEVKYNRSKDRTGEGFLLWSLIDGEMVVDASKWEKTHGFYDCLKVGADRNDFKIINALTSKGGAMDRDALAKMLSVENETLDLWIEGCRRKNLIVQNGNNIRLHLQNPKMHVIPETKIDQWIVMKPSKASNILPQKYRPYQIEKLIKSAFGNDFAIRKATEIFLPIYSITVQNPDGSQMTTYWNALNGERLDQSFQIE